MKDPRFHIDRSTLSVDGLQRTYRILHLSDAHIHKPFSCLLGLDLCKYSQLKVPKICEPFPSTQRHALQDIR